MSGSSERMLDLLQQLSVLTNWITSLDQMPRAAQPFWTRKGDG